MATETAEQQAAMALVADVLEGRVRGIARMISLAEAGAERSRPALAEIHRHTGNAHVVGITGVPGSGKSTLVRSLARTIRESGRKVGIVAIDPSSPYSGGAILGDRVRMTDLAGDAGVFIRTMAAGGALGGLARASLDVVDVLDAAGFDVVLIETVGVGQDEVDIVKAAHTVVVLSAPGLGDDIQAIKAGVLEIADIHAVGKCDRADAAETVSELKAMLSLGRPGKGRSDWSLPVIATSAEKETGIEELLQAIDAHRAYLDRTGEMENRRRQNLELRILVSAEDIIHKRLTVGLKDELAAIIEDALSGGVDPHGAAVKLLELLKQK